MNLRLYPGWLGVHTRDQAPGAMPNGTRVVKTMLEPGDGHPVGAMGTVIGSIEAPQPAHEFQSRFFYFIAWDDRPRLAVGVASAKIARAP